MKLGWVKLKFGWIGESKFKSKKHAESHAAHFVQFLNYWHDYFVNSTPLSPTTKFWILIGQCLVHIWGTENKGEWLYRVEHESLF